MRAITRTIFLAAALAGGCAPRAFPTAADHPTRAEAPTGRLAGPPAALRPGAAAPRPEPDPPASEPAAEPQGAPAHDHGSHP